MTESRRMSRKLRNWSLQELRVHDDPAIDVSDGIPEYMRPDSDDERESQSPYRRCWSGKNRTHRTSGTKTVQDGEQQTSRRNPECNAPENFMRPVVHSSNEIPGIRHHAANHQRGKIKPTGAKTPKRQDRGWMSKRKRHAF